MKFLISLTWSQQPATGPYPESNESNPGPFVMLLPDLFYY